MALGDASNFNNGNNNKKYEDSYYSRLVISNPNGKFLKFRFWAGKLAMSIAEVDSSQQKFAYKETATAFFNPMKAKILAEELKKFIVDPAHKPVGVVIGAGDPNTCVTFIHDGDNTSVDICKVDAQGNRSGEDVFVFQKDYHYSVEYKDFKKLDFSKNYFNTLEIEAVIELLESFFKASNGAYSYAVMDMSRFNFSRLKSNTEAIMDKLGIQRASSKGPGFFSGNNGGSEATSNTVEDIDDLL